MSAQTNQADAVPAGPDPRFRSDEARRRYLAFYDERSKKWPTPSDARYVNTSYGQTFVRVSGPTNADPLVLLHGLSSSSLGWIPYISAFSRNYRTYAPDTMGDPGRSVPTKKIRSAGDYGLWLDEVCDGLKLIRNVRLAGASYGGWLAGQYALHAPNRVSKLVLLAPAGTVLRTRIAFTSRFIAEMLGLYSIERLFSWLWEDFARMDPVALQQQVMGKKLERECVKRSLIIAPTILTDAQLQSLEMPVLFVVGEKEKMYSASQAIERLHSKAPRIKTALIPKIGHDFIRMTRDDVTRTVLGFLADC